MIHYKYLTMLCMITLLQGCSLTGFVKDKPMLERISDIKIILAAAANVISNDVSTGLITPDEARKRIGDIKEARTKVRNIESLLNVGDIEIAQMKLEAMNQLLLNIEKYIAAKSKEAAQ